MTRIIPSMKRLGSNNYLRRNHGLAFSSEEFAPHNRRMMEALKSRNLDGLSHVLSCKPGHRLEKHGIFLHMNLMDSDTNHAMSFGHTVVVTETGCELLSGRSLDLMVK